MPTEPQAATDAQVTLARLLAQYEPALWRLVHSYEPDSGRREDLFQEILLGLWRAIPQFRGASSERTWLYRIAHNIAISALDSRRRREQAEQPLPDAADFRSPAGPVDEELLSRERRNAMLAAIRELPALDRQVVILHLEGLSYDEIEQVSGLSQSAIATRLSRIRARLSEAVRGKETHS